jgi:anti-anti-sigma factor
MDTSNAPDADKQVTGAIEGGASKMVFDFSETEYISSAGLRVILKAAKLLTQKGGALALAGANEQITEVLEVSGFMAMMKCHNSLDEAIAGVS